MRIDLNALPPMIVPGPVAQPQGPGSLFEDLLTTPEIEDVSDAKGRVVAQQHSFSFDALGLLGVGGGGNVDAADEPKEQINAPAETKAVTTVAPSVVTQTAPMENVASQDHLLPRQAVERQRSAAPDSPAASPVLDAQIAAAPETRAPPISTQDAAAVAAVSQTPEVPMPSGGRVNLFIAGAGRVGHAPAVVPNVAVVRAASGLLSASATAVARMGPVSHGTVSSFVDMPEAEGRAVAKETSSAFALEKQAKSSADPVSVAVAEADGMLHVIAAAPDLTEDAKLKIRNIAQDIAQAIGVKLGEFSLNGAKIKPFLKYFGRSQT